MKLYEAWRILRKHDLEVIDIMVVKCNPKTQRIEKDTTKNTSTRVWIEIGYMGPTSPFDKDIIPKYFFVSYHHYKLDAGAKTLDQAIIKSAKKAKAFYKNNGEQPS